MGLRKEYDEDNYPFSDFSVDEDVEELTHKKMIRKQLDDHLERKRIKEEFDELDGEFDWEEFNK